MCLLGARRGQNEWSRVRAYRRTWGPSRLEIRTAAGPSSAVQFFSGGLVHRLAAVNGRPRRVPAAVSATGSVAHEHLAGTELVAVGALRRWVGDPLAGRGLSKLAQHTSQITARRRYLEWRLAVHEPAPPSRIGAGSNPERCRSPESCRACVQDERDGRGIRRQRFCMPPIGIVTAPPTRTWRTW